MHHGDRQLLFIRLGHLVLETPLGDAAPERSLGGQQRHRVVAQRIPHGRAELGDRSRASPVHAVVP